MTTEPATDVNIFKSYIPLPPDQNPALLTPTLLAAEDYVSSMTGLAITKFPVTKTVRPQDVRSDCIVLLRSDIRDPVDYMPERENFLRFYTPAGDTQKNQDGEWKMPGDWQRDGLYWIIRGEIPAINRIQPVYCDVWAWTPNIPPAIEMAVYIEGSRVWNNVASREAVHTQLRPWIGGLV